MNDSLKIKILGGLVAILVLMNVGLMSYLWFAPHHGRSGGPHDGQGPGGLMISEFHFTDQQQQRFEELRNAHHSAMMDINAKNLDLHSKLFHDLSDSSGTSTLADSLIGQILILLKSKEKVTYDHLAQVRQMCSPAQQKLFDRMIVKAMSGAYREDGWAAPPPR